MAAMRGAAGDEDKIGQRFCFPLTLYAIIENV
jgi:hypothetical protein